VFFAWDAMYSVNIKKIDAQHQQLFDFFQQLAEGMEVGQGKNVVGSVLKGILQYTQTHFAYEEQLMKIAGYAEYDIHQKLHQELIHRVVELYDEFQQGKALSVKTSIFLRDWLTNHILKIDKKYMIFLNSKGIR